MCEYASHDAYPSVEKHRFELHESNPSVAADNLALPGVDLWPLEPQPPRGGVKQPAGVPGYGCTGTATEARLYLVQ